jgi:hypothetical protein
MVNTFDNYPAGDNAVVDKITFSVSRKGLLIFIEGYYEVEDCLRYMNRAGGEREKSRQGLETGN